MYFFGPHSFLRSLLTFRHLTKVGLKRDIFIVDLVFFCDFIAGFVYWGQQFVFQYGTTICFALPPQVVCGRGGKLKQSK
jgi:hypothetical protein